MPEKGSSDSVAVIGTTFLRGCRLRSRSGDKLWFSWSRTSILHPPWASKALQLLDKELVVSLPAGCERPGEMGWGLASDVSPCWTSKTHPAFSLDATPKTSISIHLLLRDSLQQRYQPPTESHTNNGSCSFLGSDGRPTRHSTSITSLRSSVSQPHFTVRRLGSAEHRHSDVDPVKMN